MLKWIYAGLYFFVTYSLKIYLLILKAQKKSVSLVGCDARLGLYCESRCLNEQL